MTIVCSAIQSGLSYITVTYFESNYCHVFYAVCPVGSLHPDHVLYNALVSSICSEKQSNPLDGYTRHCPLQMTFLWTMLISAITRVIGAVYVSVCRVSVMTNGWLLDLWLKSDQQFYIDNRFLNIRDMLIPQKWRERQEDY